MATKLAQLLSMLLPSKAQIILFWGPEFIVFYNDAYRPVFGAKHPHALGRPGQVAWSEIWDSLRCTTCSRASCARVKPFGARTSFYDRTSGFLEETYFDVSYDPVRVESDDVGGVYCIVAETTERVIGARRMALLKDLAARQTSARTTRDAYVLAMEISRTIRRTWSSPWRTWAMSFRAARPDAEAASTRTNRDREGVPRVSPGFEGRRAGSSSA